MKNLLLYIVCFFALLACNKEESVRLQKEETIIAGTVTEQQRGTVIEAATVYLLEYLYPGNDDKCGTCQKIIDSTLTNANGNFEFRFNAKQGTNWNYKTWCQKQNYITKIASRFNDIVKAKTNTANLELIATGGLEVVLYNHVGKEWQIWLGNGYDYGVNPDTINIIESKNSQAFSEFIITAYYCRKPMCDEKKYQQESYEILPNQTVKDTIHFYGN